MIEKFANEVRSLIQEEVNNNEIEHLDHPVPLPALKSIICKVTAFTKKLFVKTEEVKLEFRSVLVPKVILCTYLLFNHQK